MKSFIEHLTAAQKTYEFRIKIANYDPTDDMDKLEAVLEAYGVNSVGKPESQPIVENNMDFPSLGACEVYTIEAVLNYPVTDQQLRSIIKERWCCVPEAQIVVIPRSHPEELWRNNEGELVEHEGSVLEKEELEQETTSAGEDYSMIKVLHKENYEEKKIKIETASGEDNEMSKGSLNDEPQGTQSPVGSK